MVSKPKEILFKKIYPLKGGRMGTLFASQKELAELIINDSVGEYRNVESLSAFLSQALKVNAEKGAKPLPSKLNVLISLAFENKVSKKTLSDLDKEWYDSCYYWKSSEGYADITGEVFLGELNLAVDKSDSGYFFLPEVLDIGETADISYQLYAMFFGEYKLDNRYALFFPNIASIALFWDNITRHRGGNHKDVLKRNAEENKKGRIITYIINPEQCIIPLYFFTLQGKKHLTVVNTFSASFETTNSPSFIKYSLKDSNRIAEQKLFPILSKEELYGVKEITYKELHGL